MTHCALIILNALIALLLSQSIVNSSDITFPAKRNIQEAFHVVDNKSKDRDTNLISFNSQLNEDKFLFHYFFGNSDKFSVNSVDATRKWTYLELGALNGLTYSNTLFFEKKYGWRGLLIEAIPNMCKALTQNRPNNIIGCGAVCREHGSIQFLENGAKSGSFSMGMSQQHYQNHLKGESKNITVPCAPLSAYLTHAGIKHVHFFSLDVEHQEYHVLKTIDWSSFTFDVLLVEVGKGDGGREKNNQNLRQLLSLKGYEFIVKQRNNELWVNPKVDWVSDGIHKIKVDVIQGTVKYVTKH